MTKFSVNLIDSKFHKNYRFFVILLAYHCAWGYYRLSYSFHFKTRNRFQNTRISNSVYIFRHEQLYFRFLTDYFSLLGNRTFCRTFGINCKPTTILSRLRFTRFGRKESRLRQNSVPRQSAVYSQSVDTHCRTNRQNQNKGEFCLHLELHNCIHFYAWLGLIRLCLQAAFTLRLNCINIKLCGRGNARLFA